MDSLGGVINLLLQIEKDSTVPKNIRLKIKNAILVLNEPADLAIRIDRSLQELDNVTNDPGVPSYTRTQIWNVVSMLESNK